MAKALIALAVVCGAYLVSANRRTAPKVEVILAEKLSLGEGPHWDPVTHALYWVDIFESTVLKYDPCTENITRVVVDRVNKTKVSFVVPVTGSTDKFTIGYGHRIAVLTWDGISTDPTNLEIIVDVDQGTDNRFNDGKADPKGRLWSGTSAEYNPDLPREFTGTLYRLNDDGKTVTSYLKNVGLSNGLAWSSDNKTMYYIDSYNQTVSRFDYDIETGDISNQSVVFNVTNYGITGSPDGMTIDNNNKLWVSLFYEGGVYQVDPLTGSILQSVNISGVPFTTSCTFGGLNRDELYITTASSFDTNNTSSNAGYTYKVTGLGSSAPPAAAASL